MSIIQPVVVVSPFCQRRYVPDAPRSHFEGSLEDLLRRVHTGMHQGDVAPGYRDGVIRVFVDPSGFFSPVVDLKEGDRVSGVYERRQEGEEPRLELFIEGGEKLPARTAEIVLYSHAVLCETGEQSCDADYEVIAINASPEMGEAPIKPGTLMANHFQVSGGTPTNMDDHEFVEALRKSFLYWRGKASLKPG